MRNYGWDGRAWAGLIFLIIWIASAAFSVALGILILMALAKYVGC